MASLIPITRKADAVKGYQLTSPADMLAALQYLAPGGGVTGTGYLGTINLQNISAPTWTMSIFDPVQSSNQTGGIGDWIILDNNSVASICPAAKFASFYTNP